MGSELGICALPENKRIFPAFLEIFGLVCAISALNLWCVLLLFVHFREIKYNFHISWMYVCYCPWEELMVRNQQLHNKHELCQMFYNKDSDFI